MNNDPIDGVPIPCTDLSQFIAGRNIIYQDEGEFILKEIGGFTDRQIPTVKKLIMKRNDHLFGFYKLFMNHALFVVKITESQAKFILNEAENPYIIDVCPVTTNGA